MGMKLNKINSMIKSHGGCCKHGNSEEVWKLRAEATLLGRQFLKDFLQRCICGNCLGFEARQKQIRAH